MMARHVIRNPLLLPELFHYILDHVDEPSRDEREEVEIPVNYISPKARETFFALAQTCRAISEPSLDRLWRMLDSLEPLIRCFTRDTSAFRRFPMEDDDWEMTPPSSSQWAIIRRYTGRVRELEINPFDPSLNFLRCTGSRPLFPNLRVLFWYRCHTYSDAALLIQRLLAPGLISLEGHFKGNEDENKDPPAKQIFEQYALICPNLKFLRWHCNVTSHALSDSIPHLTKVENLTLSRPLDPIPTKHVILSAQYKVLRIILDHHSIQQTISPVDIPFPSVEKMVLEIWDFGYLTSLLRPHRQMFRSVTFKLRKDEPQPPARTIHSLFDVLATPQRINLVHTINVEHTYPLWEGQPLEGAPMACCITYETLSPLTLLRHLRTVDIRVRNLIFLGDDELAALTRNWPSLEVLRLDCRSRAWPWSSAKYVTLHGLLALIVNCPRLRILCLPMDARVVPMDASPDIRNEGVTRAEFPYLLVSESALVAEFLRKHLPRVHCRRPWSWWAYRGVEEGRLWEEVRNMMSS